MIQDVHRADLKPCLARCLRKLTSPVRVLAVPTLTLPPVFFGAYRYHMVRAMIFSRRSSLPAMLPLRAPCARAQTTEKDDALLAAGRDPRLWATSRRHCVSPAAYLAVSIPEPRTHAPSLSLRLETSHESTLAPWQDHWSILLMARIQGVTAVAIAIADDVSGGRNSSPHEVRDF